MFNLFCCTILFFKCFFITAMLNDLPPHRVEWFYRKGRFLEWRINVVVFLVSITLLYFIHDFLDYSPSSQHVIYTVNNNDRAVEYFEGTVQKKLLSGEINVSDNNGITTIKAVFHVYNDKKEGVVDIHLVQIGDKTFVHKLVVSSYEDKPIAIIKPNIETSSYSTNNPTIKDQYYMDYILQKLERDSIHGPVYFIFKRSDEFNDFMQVQLFVADDDIHYILEYKESSTPENKEIYSAKDANLTRDDILKLFYSYATGTDFFKKQVEWELIEF